MSASKKRHFLSQDTEVEYINNALLAGDTSFTSSSSPSKKLHFQSDSAAGMLCENDLNGDSRQNRLSNTAAYSSVEDADDHVMHKITDNNTVVNTKEIANTDPIESGQITSVYVENFMCYRKCTVSFCKNLNFVTGSNGSGTKLTHSTYAQPYWLLLIS